MELNKQFTITYYSNKDKKHITRRGKWTELSREWVSKGGEKLFTYYDITNEGYRTAKGQYTLIAVGGSNA